MSLQANTSGKRKNQLVLIGRDIDHDKLREQLQACVAH
ncbi:GTP-binding protein [bacterium]|nr:GTP-binding protein [bacterium]